MTRTFLVAVNLEDTSNLVGVSEEIHDVLSDEFEVESVKPWEAPVTNPNVFLPPPA
jgi:hypothetical protein